MSDVEVVQELACSLAGIVARRRRAREYDRSHARYALQVERAVWELRRLDDAEDCIAEAQHWTRQGAPTYALGLLAEAERVLQARPVFVPKGGAR